MCNVTSCFYEPHFFQFFSVYTFMHSDLQEQKVYMCGNISHLKQFLIRFMNKYRYIKKLPLNTQD